MIVENQTKKKMHCIPLQNADVSVNIFDYKSPESNNG